MNLFITRNIISEKDPREFVLEGQEAVHASKVLRIREGGRLDATDGKGKIYRGKVVECSGRFVRAEISQTENHPKSLPHIVLAIARIKKRDRMEFAIEKAVELGVTEFVVYQGQNSIKKGLRFDRLEATASSAMKQSLRAWTPIVRESRNLASILAENSSVRTIIADEKRPFTYTNPEKWKKEEKLMFVIGPEGGFSEEEMALLNHNGCERISLGSYRLRTETAVIAVANLFTR